MFSPPRHRATALVHRAVRLADKRLAAAKCVSVKRTADLEEFGVEVIALLLQTLTIAPIMCLE